MTTEKGGRPLKFKTVEELTDQIEKYFSETPKEEWTVTGLAIALDTFRSVLIDYGNGLHDTEDKEYSYTIKKAKHMVEHSYEVDLKKHGRSGTIFALKNFDWKDKNELEHSGALTVTLTKYAKRGDNTTTPIQPETIPDTSVGGV
jgi:hypothetical protein